jgi:hypothetical protein
LSCKIPGGKQSWHSRVQTGSSPDVHKRNG